MITTPNDLPVLLAAGIGTGVLGAILGTGGGVFLIPVLVLGLDVEMHHAVATSIVTVVATSSAVASVNVERGTANMKLGMTLEIATALGAIVGGLSAEWLSPRLLEAMFAVLLAPTSVMMWLGKKEGGEMTPDEGEAHINPTVAATTQIEEVAKHHRYQAGLLDGQYYDAKLGRTVRYSVQRLWGGMLVSLVAGVVSGLLGIGGGVFKVPAMHLICNLPIKVAAATSNFMIGVTAAASAFLYFGRGEVRPVLTASVVIGVLGGSALGSVLNQYIHGRTVSRLFAVLLIGVAIQMLCRAWVG